MVTSNRYTYFQFRSFGFLKKLIKLRNPKRWSEYYLEDFMKNFRQRARELKKLKILKYEWQ